MAGHARETLLEALCHGPERQPTYLVAGGGSQLPQNDFQFGVSRSALACRNYGEETSPARPSGRKSRLAEALEAAEKVSP